MGIPAACASNKDLGKLSLEFLGVAYKNKSAELRKKVIKYQTGRRLSLEKITQQRAESRKKLLERIDPILNTYIKENGILLVIDKKNVLGGNSDLDITNIITEKLDKEFPSLNLQ